MRLRKEYSALSGLMKIRGSYKPGPAARASVFRACSALEQQIEQTIIQNSLNSRTNLHTLTKLKTSLQSRIPLYVFKLF